MAFIESFKDNINPSVFVEEVNAHINDREFIDRVVKEFLSIMN